MSDPSANDAPAGTSEASAAAPEGSEASSSGEDKPRKRRRRRGRGKGKSKAASPAPSGETPQQAPAEAAALPAGLAALAGGLLSHIDDRQVRCSADGCDNQWTWTAAEQIRSMGQPPPKRLCNDCGAVSDREVRCSVDSCKRTWTWSRDAQLKHRSWKRRDGGARGRGQDKRRRRRNEGVPKRRCDLCQEKVGRLVEREGICKVHGCTRTVSVEREYQLRAWAGLNTDDLSVEGPLPKKMCEVCREFCRTHPDRPVDCGRPGCDRTWTYKTGAQLQAFLAGRLEDPMRLACEGNDCDVIKAEAAQLAQLGGVQVGAARNVEIMPCIVLGCEGVWAWRSSMNIAPCNDGDQPVDRMCDTHRAEHGAKPRASNGVSGSPTSVSDPKADAEASSPASSKSNEASAEASDDAPAATAEPNEPATVSEAATDNGASDTASEEADASGKVDGSVD